MKAVRASSRCLLDEKPLLVLPSLACLVGLHGAIVLQQLHYWIVHNREQGRSECFQQGRWWTYGTQEDWLHRDFPFLSLSTLRRVFDSLQEKGLIVTAALSTRPLDRTRWYSIDYDRLEAWREMARARSAHSEQIGSLAMCSEWTEACDQDGQKHVFNLSAHEENTRDIQKRTTTERSVMGAVRSVHERKAVDAVVKSLVASGVTACVAEEIAATYGYEAILRQIAMLPYREARNPPATLVRAIRENWATPPAYEKACEELQRQERVREATRRREEERKEREAQEAARRERLERLWLTLSEEERTAIDTEACARMKSESPFLALQLERGIQGKVMLSLMEAQRHAVLAERCDR